MIASIMYDLADDGNIGGLTDAQSPLSVLEGVVTVTLLLRETVFNGCQRVSASIPRESRDATVSGRVRTPISNIHGALGTQVVSTADTSVSRQAE